MEISIEEYKERFYNETIDYTNFEIIDGIIIHNILGIDIVLDHNMKSERLEGLIGCQKHVLGYYISDVRRAIFDIQNQKVNNYSNIFDNIN